jgi:hypothetical protein
MVYLSPFHSHLHHSPPPFLSTELALFPKATLAAHYFILVTSSLSHLLPSRVELHSATLLAVDRTSIFMFYLCIVESPHHALL